MTETATRVRAPGTPGAQQALEERLTGLAIRRGAMGRCPNCGEGRLFRSYLKVNDQCPACGEDLHHQRADDGPAYITILVVSHLLTAILLTVFIEWRPSVWAMMVGFLGAAVVLSLLMLPRIKGAMIGLQWARRMHGFGDPVAGIDGPADPR